MRRRSFVVALIATVLATAGCGAADGSIEISEARIGQPRGPNAALYLTADNNGDADRLIGAVTNVAASVEIHETSVGEDGTMGMRPVDGLELLAGGSLILAPGGFHLMLIDAEWMEVGEAVEVTLRWEKAGEMKIEAEVVEPSDTGGQDG